MERESGFRQLINSILKFGDRIFHKTPNQAASETLTSFVGMPHDRETLLRLHYYSLLKGHLQSFGATYGLVTMEDVATLLQNMTTTFPEADRFMGYPFSQLAGDLQTTLLTNPEVRNATIQWMSDVRRYLIERHQSLERETGEWEEDLDQPDLVFRGMTREVGRQIKASENAIKLLGGDQDLLVNPQT